ncbi:hypothetical protein CA13_40070 [Planctomycetes bacterium CA13]|uniref:Protein BatD n=1 Tax=Novipirellula herctigrandis TaxID=2527986 RepID=A0A5C5Z5L8_9BACT|nr:hypothetical protein CA13_40070 [Planctomycetes bacterium CA13]
MIRLKRFALLVMLCAVVSAAQDAMGAELGCSTQVDRSEVKILDPITLSIVIDAPSNLELEFSDSEIPEAGESLGPFEIVSVESKPSMPIGTSQRQWLWRFKLQTLQIGEHQIPSIEIRYRLNGESELLVTEPATVHVLSVLTDDESPSNPRPIKGQMSVETTTQSFGWYWWIGLAFAATVVGIAAMVFGKRRRRIVPTTTQWTLRRLEAVSQAVTAKEINSSQAYLRTARIARDFAASHHGLDPEVMTTDEVVSAIRTGPWLSDESRHHLTSLLREADEMKFAGHSETNRPNTDGPEVAKCNETIEWLRSLVQAVDSQMLESQEMASKETI